MAHDDALMIGARVRRIRHHRVLSLDVLAGLAGQPYLPPDRATMEGRAALPGISLAVSAARRGYEMACRHGDPRSDWLRPVVVVASVTVVERAGPRVADAHRGDRRTSVICSPAR
ncbi:MAG: hypothetical protein JO309_15905 [Pseudonocardiales bacterium]|nr:hypothetical protein [Pseudonocardiales bacterium]MBV9730855.1 hypothetical protein [Pseudonocardiales bacterium]